MKQGWGIAFSGGGQRGFAHVGVIRALEEFGVEPVAIAGTSAGSIFGGLWACGKTAEEMMVWSRQLETRKLLDFYFSLPHLLKTVFQLMRYRLVDLSLPPAIFRGELIYKILLEYLGDIRVQDAIRPLAIPAVDLDTGEEVLFSNDSRAQRAGVPVMPKTVKLADAIRASIGIPGVFAPWPVAGRRLIDGGLADNLPIGRLRPMGAVRLIAVDVGEPIPYDQKASDSLPGILERSVAILTRQLVTCRQEDADIVILPTLPPVTIGDFRHNELLLESGYQQACSALSAYFQDPTVP